MENRKIMENKLSRAAEDAVIERASEIFGDLICRFDGNQAFISAGANDSRGRSSFEIITEQRGAFLDAMKGTGWRSVEEHLSGPRGGRSSLFIRMEYSV